jgi:hypothetical protein
MKILIFKIYFSIANIEILFKIQNKIFNQHNLKSIFFIMLK